MFVSTIRKKNKCYEHTAFSYKHIPICYNEIGSELPVKDCPSPANTDEQGKVKGEYKVYLKAILTENIDDNSCNYHIS